MNQSSFRFEGGPWHNRTEPVKVAASVPPPWLHIHPVPGDPDNVAVYERQQRPAAPGAPPVWYYAHREPTEAAKASE